MATSLTPNRDGVAGTTAAMQSSRPGGSGWLGGLDRLDSHTAVINDHSAHLSEHDDRLDEQDGRLDALESHLAGHHGTDVQDSG